MKRSEMLREMQNAMTMYGAVMLSTAAENAVCERILTRMEEKGMKAPDTGKGPIIGRQYMSTHLDYSQEPDHRWEKE